MNHGAVRLCSKNPKQSPPCTIECRRYTILTSKVYRSRRWLNKYENAFRSGTQQKSPCEFTCWYIQDIVLHTINGIMRLHKYWQKQFCSPFIPLPPRLPPSPKLARVTQFAVNYLFYFLCSLRNYLPLFCFSLFLFVTAFLVFKKLHEREKSETKSSPKMLLLPRWR